MQNLAVLFLKLALQFVAWVFILSIEWKGTTLFQSAKSVLVDNAYISALKGQAKLASEQASGRISMLLQQSKSTLGTEKKIQ